MFANLCFLLEAFLIQHCDTDAVGRPLSSSTHHHSQCRQYNESYLSFTVGVPELT
jgi:hypothetical protein